jgi:hypothetical protein
MNHRSMHNINTAIVKADDRVSPVSERKARRFGKEKEEAHVSHSSNQTIECKRSCQKISQSL